MTNTASNSPLPTCEIIIPIVLKIPIYIEPVVVEMPTECDLSAHEAVLSQAEPATLNQPVNPSKILPIKALGMVLLASASAAAFYVLASFSLFKLCPDLVCLRASQQERLIIQLPVDVRRMRDRLLP